MPLRLEDDLMCYACGKENLHGLKLQFEHPQKGVLKAAVAFSKHHQGFKDIVHGGMIALVLDEMMVNLAWKEGIPAVTGELTVRLKKAVKVGQKIRLEGRLESGGEGSGRLLRTRAIAIDESGQTVATAEATCVRIKDHNIKFTGS